MKNVKDFDVRQFAPDSSASETTVIGGGARQSKRSVLSEQSAFTGRNDASGQTERTPPSETIEETASTETSEQTRRAEEIAPISLSGRDDKTRQTASTSANEQSVPNHHTASAQTTEPPQSTLTPPSRVSYHLASVGHRSMSTGKRF